MLGQKLEIEAEWPNLHESYRQANKEQVNVMGTIGLLCAMIENQLLAVDDAFQALDRMKAGKRRLPWPEAEKMLNALR